jgi:AcrR family transcriptional regulator
MPLSQEGRETSPTQRDLALERSLEGPRQRAGDRLVRLLDTARGIAMESPDSDFTVGEVAEGAGISLKTLYQCFDSKEELLLALLEDECLVGAEMLRQALLPLDSAAERLRRFVGVVFSFAESRPDYARFIYRLHQRLSVDHRPAVARALAPMVSVVEDEIRSAVELGLADPGDPRVAAEIAFSLVVDGLSVFTTAATAEPEVVEAISRFVCGGLRLAETPHQRAHRTRRR